VGKSRLKDGESAKDTQGEKKKRWGKSERGGQTGAIKAGYQGTQQDQMHTKKRGWFMGKGLRNKAQRALDSIRGWTRGAASRQTKSRAGAGSKGEERTKIILRPSSMAGLLEDGTTTEAKRKKTGRETRRTRPFVKKNRGTGYLGGGKHLITGGGWDFQRTGKSGCLGPREGKLPKKQ